MKDIATNPSTDPRKGVEMPEGSGNEELVEGEPIFDGGSEEDRRKLRELHDAVFRANDKLDIDALRKVWSDDPNNVYFNTNGHFYHGLDDWANIWDHYRPKMHSIRPAPTYNTRIIIRGDAALIIDQYLWRFWEWSGDVPRPSYATNSPYLRSTQVCFREQGDWKVVHAHFSSGRIGLRPDQGGPE
jgi:SnoaL-like protein